LFFYPSFFLWQRVQDPVLGRFGEGKIQIGSVDAIVFARQVFHELLMGAYPRTVSIPALREFAREDATRDDTEWYRQHHGQIHRSLRGLWGEDRQDCFRESKKIK